jgi:hypothetical protein
MRRLYVKKLILPFSLMTIFVLMLTGTPRSMAQTNPTPTPIPSGQTTTTTTGTGTGNDIQGFLVVCADSAVINFTGTLVAGFDIYFQLFAGTTGSGTPLSGLRQVQADGAVRFSENVAYPAGTTVAAGQSASAMVLVARETDPSRVDFDFVLTDVQDGCGAQSAQNPLGTSVEVSGSAADSATSGTTTSAQHILAPNGGILNPNLQAEPEVVIGARPSVSFRSQTPGLIFAECNAYPMAIPGLVLDSDQVTVFWSWFTNTEAQMEEHLAHAQYSVKLNQAPFPNVVRSDIEQRDGNFWVFYSVNVGNLAPGWFEVEYRLTWDQPVNDGFQDFGPGTDNPIQANNCLFEVVRNPNVTGLSYSGMYLPGELPAHYIQPDY